ncbi:DNA repair protein RecN [Criblamydia sequanensis]|uniref:DNA repair protein RecN n=1 Tax=Candidatus Criblamydia sequanensis CRIB-18 TaxID=1437425 RepID=A0A090E3H1_9BACT|nr:DNA repair protein RecN [Criblamydia sequanensis]CDR35129.1 DNA repair protein RecN [Criblamydia sequanensis CRIB-18]
MLKSLSIQDFILIDRCQIEFSEEFNVITGETGSGKSAFLSALALISGSKASTELIRQGKEKATLEAIFENYPQEALEILQESGIDTEGDLLIIKREIFSNGKNRNFINHQTVQASLLKKVGQSLIQIVSQNDNRCLKELETHIRFLDQFCQLESELQDYKACYKEWVSAKTELENFQNSLYERKLKINLLNEIVDEITSVNPKEDEEELLFQEYQLLANANDLQEGMQSIVNLIDGEDSLLSNLKQAHKSLHQLSRIDSLLASQEESLKMAIISLEDVTQTLEKRISRVEFNPYKMEEASKRLETLSRLKKKYGSELKDVLLRKELAERELTLLEKSDESLEEKKLHLQNLQDKRDLLSSKLTEKRTASAKRLESEIIKEFASLNLSSGRFKIEITPKECGETGKDRVEFFLAPNPGEPFVSLVEAASGGEVSRILIALLVLTTKENENRSILFDEIDANIGGTSASLVGKKLKEIGKRAQVLAVTHFPQVAIEASFHLRIHKETKDGRTVTFAKAIASEHRMEELKRMRGEAALEGALA